MTGSVFEDDPFGEIKKEKKTLTPTAREVNALHHKSDVDSGPFAQHHTIGIGRNQSPPGDHVHDGVSSRKLGAERGYVLTGAKGGNVALTNLIAMLKNVIEFTDNTT